LGRPTGRSAASNQDTLAHARARGSTIFHPSGTCMMAPAANPTAVVDHELRVHGVSGSGNTNAACIMIGEKCAEMMLAAR
jgi:choline dehydrogenase